MADFFLPTLFVVPGTNTLPTTGTTADLAAGQFGVFDPSYATLTAGTVAAAPYVYLAQGRIENVPSLGTKRTDKMYANKLIEFYQIPSVSSAVVQITEVDNFNIKCEEDLVLTLRLFSSYIELAYFNGLTRSYTVQAPCCDCGADPCLEVDPEAIVDAFVAAVNADVLVNRYIVASKDGTGVASTLVLTGQALDRYGNPCSPTAFTYEYDKLRFDTFAYKNPETTQDFITADACDVFADVTVTQESTYPRGSGDEIFEMEKRYFSYHTTQKSIFRNIEYDGAFERYSDPNAFYTTYYIRQYDPENQAWELSERYDQMVIVAVPTGSAAATTVNAILVARFGTPTIVTTV